MPRRQRRSRNNIFSLVYYFFQQLVGSLPLVMMFDMPDNTELIDSEVQKIGEELEVSISIKPKHRQGSKSVLIKAQERSASAIYSARYRLLKGGLQNPL